MNDVPELARNVLVAVVIAPSRVPAALLPTTHHCCQDDCDKVMAVQKSATKLTPTLQHASQQSADGRQDAKLASEMADWAPTVRPCTKVDRLLRICARAKLSAAVCLPYGSRTLPLSWICSLILTSVGRSLCTNVKVG